MATLDAWSGCFGRVLRETMVTPHKTVQAALDQLALLYTIEEIQLAAKALGAPK